jgi:hypothetical protein
METVFNTAAMLAIVVISIEMGLFLNWALLSVMLKAMNYERRAPNDRDSVKG